MGPHLIALARVAGDRDLGRLLEVPTVLVTALVIEAHRRDVDRLGMSVDDRAPRIAVRVRTAKIVAAVELADRDAARPRPTALRADVPLIVVCVAECRERVLDVGGRLAATVRTAPNTLIELFVECHDHVEDEAYEAWSVERRTDGNGIALVGNPAITGDVAGADPYGYQTAPGPSETDQGVGTKEASE